MILHFDLVALLGLVAAISLFHLCILGWEERIVMPLLSRLYALLALADAWWALMASLQYTGFCDIHPILFSASQMLSGLLGPGLFLFTLVSLGLVDRWRPWWLIVLLPGLFGPINLLLAWLYIPASVQRESLDMYLAGTRVSDTPIVRYAFWYGPLLLLHMVQLYLFTVASIIVATWASVKRVGREAASAPLLALIYLVMLVGVTVTDLGAFVGGRHVGQRLSPLINLPFVLLLYRFMRGRAVSLRRLLEERELHREIVTLSENLAQANGELNRSLEETRAAQTELVHAARMASLGQLTAGIAHEINSPIAAVSRAIEHAADNLRVLLESLQPTTVISNALGAGFRSDAISSTQRRMARRRLEARLAGRAGVDRHIEDLGQIAAVEEGGEGIVETMIAQEDEHLVTSAVAAFQLGSSLRVIQVAAQKVATVIRGLRAYSRVDEETVSDVDVRTGIEDSLIVHQHEMRDGIEVVRSFDDIPPIRARPAELNQVWSNLIRNAVQAMDGRGRLTIAVRAADAGVEIGVSDTGCGIPPEVCGRIFEPHFSTKRGTEFGLGLGLAIARSIVDHHGGRIVVDSQPGATTFRIWLPKEAP